MSFIHHDLFLFDFDGLLVDTEPLHFQAYQDALASYGVSFDWDFNKYCKFAHAGTQVFSDAVYASFPELSERNWEIVRDKKKVCYLGLVKAGPVRLMPGSEVFVRDLLSKGLKCCIVTNSTRQELEFVAKHLPLVRDLEWIAREDYAKPKPAPDGYLEACKKFNGKNPVGFEDTLKGILSLKAAGIRPILVCSNTHPQLEDERLANVEVYQNICKLHKASDNV
ncbi:MAG: HAD family phosphatase [Chlamydiales bacterium]